MACLVESRCESHRPQVYPVNLVNRPLGGGGYPDAVLELRRYRIMATIVGCFVIVVFALFFAQLATGPTSWFNRHEEQIGFFDMVHGFLYMGFLVVAALLARAQRWSILFTATTLLAGTVPILSFWAERRATAAVLAARADAAHVR